MDQETLNRIDFQNQLQTLLEEIDFMRRVHDQEISELQAMAARDTTPENREYFKNELSSAIRDIRAEYDQVSTLQLSYRPFFFLSSFFSHMNEMIKINTSVIIDM